MNYCTNCNINLGQTEIHDSKCPQCGNVIRTITNNKLIKLLSEINEAMYLLSNKSLHKNPKDIIAIAKTIQIGEKKLLNEYNKKIEQMTDIDYELSVMTKFAEQMKYKL